MRTFASKRIRLVSADFDFVRNQHIGLKERIGSPRSPRPLTKIGMPLIVHAYVLNGVPLPPEEVAADFSPHLVV